MSNKFTNSVRDFFRKVRQPTGIAGVVLLVAVICGIAVTDPRIAVVTAAVTGLVGLFYDQDAK